MSLSLRHFSFHKGSDVLVLKTSSTESISVLQGKQGDLQIFPNPATDQALVEFTVGKPGKVLVGMINPAGKVISQLQNFLASGCHAYRVQFPEAGLYIITVRTGNFAADHKVVSAGPLKRGVSVFYKHSVNVSCETFKNATSDVIMEYSSGDKLKFT